jgi:hypothetical protein
MADRKMAAEAAQALAHRHEEELRALHTAHDENLRQLTNDLLEESQRSIASVARGSKRSTQTHVVTKLLPVYTRQIALQRFYGQWRRWTLLEAFREDYRKVSQERDEEREECTRLRGLIARALQGYRIPHTGSYDASSNPNRSTPEPLPGSVATRHGGSTDSSVIVSSTSPPSVGAVSPMSQQIDEVSPRVQDARGGSGTRSSRTPRSSDRATPSPSRVAGEMLNFSGRVNSLMEWGDANVDATEKLVAEVQELIRRGHQLRPMEIPAASAAPSIRADRRGVVLPYHQQSSLRSSHAVVMSGEVETF